MLEFDGILYGDDIHPIIEVVQVKPLPDKTMIVTFSTGETKLFDTRILTGETFAEMQYDDVFMNPKIVDGIVTWKDEQIDVAPEFMYIMGEVIL